MVNVGIPEDIATGWVVKALEEVMYQTCGFYCKTLNVRCI
ncbi:hypothetical protein HMPREF9699_02128 [Bergeyella zoohelcum ATCC 43767]|uniref:Uncharacterized protein n=1 Tax=Bergeyella zoohelcum ATCC 43767 TaxID=883096 RepID=K1LBU7_9FLAO|nr:hypothetical protein HMPREF9699_02128 [Bergeyella zoohelcum ATCC 43767]SUV48358.1 Uncharacterised protein [Bergeyella zoohelcum]